MVGGPGDDGDEIIVDRKTELVGTKCAEMLAESIPGKHAREALF